MRWPPAVTLAIGCSLPYLALVEGSEHDKFQALAPRQTAAQGYLLRGLFGDGGDLADGISSTLRSLAGSAATCEQVHASGKLGPLRIGWDVMNADQLESQLLTKVNSIMSQASSYWSSALQVYQASEPLKAKREGANCSKYAFDSTYSCQGSTPPQCGTDGLVIPDKYLRSMRTCSKRCSPAYSCSGSCVSGGGCSCNVDSWSTQKQSYCCSMDAASASRNADCPSGCSSNTLLFVGQGSMRTGTGGIICEGGCTTTPEGEGAVNEDLHLFVTVRDTPSCVASATLVAYASWCVKDQCDRPVFGSVNFCKSHLAKAKDDISPQVNTAIHEMAHAMAFSSSLFPYFRNSDGSPMIARMANDPDDFLGSVWWSCDGSNIKFPDPNGDLLYKDISPTIVNTFSERGLTDCQCPIGVGATMRSGCVLPTTGFRVPTCAVKVTTAAVQAQAREHFGCSTLEGAELENQDTSACVIIGSHWEQRIFNGELMAPVMASDGATYVSRVTLGLFQDSGWYVVNYSWADTLTPGVHWGYKQGCNFVRQKCVNGGVPVSDRAFCASGEACSLDRMQVKRCGLVTLSGGSVPSALDYFNGAGKLGTLAEMDYCPSYSVTLTNRICTNGNTSTWVPYSNVNFMREVFSSASRCLMSTLRADVRSGSGTYTAKDSDFPTASAVCYAVSCAPDGASYVVKYSDLATGGLLDLGTCTVGGQTLTSSNLKGEVTCAPPVELCKVVPFVHLGALAPSTTARPATSSSAAPSPGTSATSSFATSSSAPTSAPETGAPGTSFSTTRAPGATSSVRGMVNGSNISAAGGCYAPPRSLFAMLSMALILAASAAS